MSTKVPEGCPRCLAAEVMPTTSVVYVKKEHIHVAMWRYDCACDWTWANEAQRKHNEQEVNKAVKAQRSYC